MEEHNAWQAFDGLERLAKYSDQQIEEFSLRLLDKEDENSVFEVYAAIYKYKEILYKIEATMRYIATNVLANYDNSYQIEGATFIPVVTRHYDFIGIDG